MPELDPIEIPNRSLFKQPEVCEIAHIQPYVLRSWEAEFPDLGTTKTAGGPRLYRRADVERVLRLKQLVYVDGLTLAGARRKLAEEARPVEPVSEESVAALLGEDARQRIRHVHRVLRELAQMLGAAPGARPASAGPAARVEEPFELRGAEPSRPSGGGKTPARAAPKAVAGKKKR